MTFRYCYEPAFDARPTAERDAEAELAAMEAKYGGTKKAPPWDGRSAVESELAALGELHEARERAKAQAKAPAPENVLPFPKKLEGPA